MYRINFNKARMVGKEILEEHIIELGMKSTSQPAFGIQKAREITIPLPPMELQKQYSRFVKYINGIMLNVQKGFDTLSMLRKLLMQKYFCADIEVVE